MRGLTNTQGQVTYQDKNITSHLGYPLYIVRTDTRKHKEIKKQAKEEPSERTAAETNIQTHTDKLSIKEMKHTNTQKQ